MPKRPIPITPRYVFARSGHLAELHALVERRGRHDAFSIIYSFGRPGLIADDELEPFRSAEIGCAAQAAKCGFALGQAVRVAEGVASGKEGIVEKSNWRRTRVDFPGERPMEFETSILREIVPQGRESA
jgi:transcription antitermination factor NusG